MKIHIKILGMLDEAEFEVGDLTLICGENNTGKTYATYSLYGYLDFIKEDYILFNLIKTMKMQDFFNKITINECIMKIPFSIMKNIIEISLEKINTIHKNNLAGILAGKEEDFSNSSFEANTVNTKRN